MHIPDGFIDVTTSLAAGVAAAGGLTIASRKASKEIGDDAAPLAGLVAAFVFAAQMLNFPVAAGTSGHLMGGALAGVLVGPWVGAVCVAIVLMVQALFADGGLTALGLNVVNMSLLGCIGGYALFRTARSVLPRTRSGVLAATFVASLLSVLLAALAFTFEYALGGAGGVSVVTVGRAMLGVHLLIGLGEGAIAAATVSTVMSVRPDLVYGAKDVHLAMAIPHVEAAR